MSPDKKEGRFELRKAVNVLVLPVSLPIATVHDVAKFFTDMFGEEQVDAGYDADSGYYLIRVFQGEWPIQKQE